MNNIQKRFILFLCGCILVRSIFVLIAKNKNNVEYLPIMGFLALLPAIAFIYLYITDGRKTGAEVFGDKIWWNKLRPIHGILYGIFAYMAIQKNQNAWIVLGLDVIVGLSGFLYYHYNEGNFSKL
jgi:nucleoside permease NupC